MGRSIIRRFKEAVKAFREGWPTVGIGVDSDERNYRSLTTTSNDLDPMSHQRHQEIARYLYDSNPMCKRLVNMQAEYVVSEGWKVRSDNEELEDLLLAFWEHPSHNLDLNLVNFAKEVSIFGEQCYKLFTNEFSGLSELGYVDPMLVTKVMHGPNPLVVDKVTVGHGTNEKVYDCAKFAYYPAASANGKPLTTVEGDTFFFKNNSFVCAARGRSDFIGVFELLDLYGQFIYSRCDRSILANNVVHDITVEGAGPAEIKQVEKDIGPITPNKMLAHNEKLKYEVKTPNLRAEDASFDDKTIRNFILGSFGFPEHFFGSGGDVNRATAMEMHEPVVRMLKTRQRLFKNQFNRILTYQKIKAKERGRLSDQANSAPFFIEFPEISYRDMQRSGLTMMYLAQSLALATDKQWLTDRQASELYAQVASGFGPDINPNPLLAAEQEADA